MLSYYPGSDWEDDALLLIAKAYYRSGKYRNAIGKIDELNAKYPASPLLTEGILFKGLSLLKVAEADSARQLLGELFLNTEQPLIVAQAHFGLAEHYISDKRFDVALEEYRISAQNASEDEWLRGVAWVGVGECLSQLQKHEEAVEFYDEMLREDIPRRLQFEATLKRAIELRLVGRAEESLASCLLLLKDGAFVDDFPRVQLEAARAHRALSQNADARERLEKLAETERRGEVGASAHYELGLLHWLVDRNDSAALAEFKAVKSTERTALVVSLADSLLSEIEKLTAKYRRLTFLESQLALIDSTRDSLRTMVAADTVWMDSTAEKRKADRPGDKGAARKGRRGAPELQGNPDDPIRRMVEAAIAAGDTLIADSSKVDSSKTSAITPADTVKPTLDSTAIAKLDSIRRLERSTEWLGLAEIHLFDRRDPDSAQHYLFRMIANPVDSLLTTQTLATLAYIARERGDTLLSDSLYTQILQTPPSDAWRSRARKALGLDDLTPTPTGQTAQLIDSAEALWQVNNDIDAARLLYILASEVADSSDTLAARALLAAARITRVGLGQDSLAGLLYAEVTKRFPGSAHAKAAQKYAPRSAGRAEPRQRQAEMEKLPEEVDDGSDPFAQVMAPAENEEVFAPDKVDEPPQLLTLPEIVDSYLRSYYPFEAYSERLRGRVELNITVRTSGEVTDVEVSKVEPEGYGFDEAARQVLSSCNFRPGRMKGKPVSVRFKQVFTFKPPEER